MRLARIAAFALFFGAVTVVQAHDGPGTLIVTASNADQNQLLVYDTSDHLLQSIPTQGKGGVSGNAGGIAARAGTVAVVNFGSKSVAVFNAENRGLTLKQLIPTASSPVSVAFGHEHLYVLGTTRIESHRIFGSHVASNPDGVVTLLKADGSAAQVGIVGPQLVITEKSNVIETVNLQDDGSVSGNATLVANIPANVDAPFGLATRGNNAYVTIAHADEIRVHLRASPLVQPASDDLVGRERPDPGKNRHV